MYISNIFFGGFMDNSKQNRKDERSDESSSYSNECCPQQNHMMCCPYMYQCPFMGYKDTHSECEDIYMGCGDMYRDQEPDFDYVEDDDARSPRPNLQQGRPPYNRPPYNRPPYHYPRPPYYYQYPYYWYGYPYYPYNKYNWKKKKGRDWD